MIYPEFQGFEPWLRVGANTAGRTQGLDGRKAKQDKADLTASSSRETLAVKAGAATYPPP